jgi:hypothetical protein
MLSAAEISLTPLGVKVGGAVADAILAEAEDSFSTEYPLFLRMKPTVIRPESQARTSHNTRNKIAS